MLHQTASDFSYLVYDSQDYEVANIEFLVSQPHKIIAFRGSDEFWDWVRDIRILPWYVKGLGWCPAGFARGGKKVFEKVQHICLSEGIDPRELVLTGHSLGGAIALIVGAIMTLEGYPPKEIIAFGAPRCGRLAILDSVEVTLYRHRNDIVPLIPPFMRRHKPLTILVDPGKLVEDHRAYHYRKAEKPK